MRKSWGGNLSYEKVKPFVPLETLKLIHNAPGQPYFDYCNSLWYNCGGGLKDKLQRLQNRAARVITGSTFDIRSDDVLNMLVWKSFDQRGNYIKSIYTYKIINYLAAPNLKRLFRRCNKGDSAYELGNHETDLMLPKPKKEFLKRSFKYNEAIHWNNYSTEAKTDGFVHLFKRIIKFTAK